MSGPKTARYTLTKEQQENLAAQNKCDNNIVSGISRFRNAVAKVNSVKRKIKVWSNSGNEENFPEIAEVTKAVESLDEQIQKIKEEFGTVLSYRRKFSSTPSKKALSEKEAILSQVNKLTKFSADIENDINAIKNIVEHINDDILYNIEKALPAAFNMNWDPESKEIMLKKSLYQKLSSLLKMELSEKLKQKVRSALKKSEGIKSYEYLCNFNAVTVVPLIDECNSYIHMQSEFGKEFDDLKNRYSSLCKLLEIHQDEFIFSTEGLNDLKNEVAFLEAELLQVQEEQYIADSIDEVMMEMGYNLIGHKVTRKDNGKRFRDELYEFKEGTVINVRYDDDGKIAMELGGTDNVDRLPDEGEISGLCDNMADFCNKFTEFEKRLAEKGVICKERLLHLPPTAEYAQIINTAEYTSVQADNKAQHHKKTSKKRLYKSEE